MASSIRAKCVYNSCVNSRGGEQSGSGQRWRGGLKEGRRTNDDNSNGMANNAVQEANEKKICANSIREFYHVILKWKISDWLICWKMFPFGWTVQCCTAFAPERWAKATQKCCVWKEKKMEHERMWDGIWGDSTATTASAGVWESNGAFIPWLNHSHATHNRHIACII